MAMTGARKGRAVLIAGPTASGKTGHAIDRARQSGAVIVNADSMQVYKGLEVLTARPGAAEQALVRHFLFGHVPPTTRYSTGKWLKDIEELLPELTMTPPEVVFVGGTGLYFEALIKGIHAVPTVSEAISRHFGDLATQLDAKGRKSLIKAADPKMAARLDTFDPQRVGRALAVLEATGRSLADWQDEERAGPLSGWQIERVVMAPPRAVIRERIATRFETMLARGAIEEVKALLALGLDPELPAMKAIGVREIAAFLKGQTDRQEMVARTVAATGQYAKRQLTWLRRRMADWTWIEG